MPQNTPNVLIVFPDKESRVLFDSFFKRVDVNGTYADSLNTALEEIGKSTVSLVLVDISTKDGHRLDVLEEISKIIKTKSNASIVVITEKPKKELISMCVELGAKGFLTKPIDKQAFVERIGRLIKIKPLKPAEGNKTETEESESTDSKKDLISELIEKLKNDKLDFSAMPQLGYKIIELLKDDSTPLPKVNEYIEKDPGIYARILKAANSAVFAGSKPVFSPKDAILRIGVKRTINYVLLISSARLFAHPNPVYEKILKEVLLHSIGTAICAREISSEIKHPNADNFFAFGLLHDIGKVLLLRILNQFSKQRDLEDMEMLENLLEQLHTKFGASLMKKWHFPQEFHEMVLCHHEQPDIAKHSKATVITSLANIIAHEIESETMAKNTKTLLKLPHTRLIGFRPKKLDDLEKIVIEEKKIMVSMLE